MAQSPAKGMAPAAVGAGELVLAVTSISRDLDKLEAELAMARAART